MKIIILHSLLILFGYSSVAQTDGQTIRFHGLDYTYKVSVHSIVNSTFDNNDSIKKYLNRENWAVNPSEGISTEGFIRMGDYEFGYYDILILIYNDKKSVTIFYKENSKPVKFKRKKTETRQNLGIGSSSTKSLILFDRKLKNEFVNEILWKNLPC